MNTEAKHILLAGGGTAGHVNPLLAVADAIAARNPEDASIITLGTAVGLEADLVPQAGYRLETIEKVPFPRRLNKAALQFPFKWKRETAKVRQLIRTSTSMWSWASAATPRRRRTRPRIAWACRS